ncbi:MAG: DUF1615 domain-containing protein [Proteobacteria bacterium]|nr:MAG: DUF1615 domain-containing protein [Pseudomonadota bacterium]
MLLCVAVVCACAGGPRTPRPAPPRPADVRALIARLLPEKTPDRAGWAADVYAAFAALELETSAANLCAALAVTEQESGFQADPPVANLPKIARAEIDRRAAQLGVPKLAVDLALRLRSPDGRSYAERIAKVRTERELSEIFEAFTGSVPMGRRLFAGWNPVRTGGPMQVGIAFAEQHAASRPYPYPVSEPASGAIRREVFTRRGGLYFGIAHLLDYPAEYDAHLYRFADFNAGRWASRNAAFQHAISVASGIPLALDGDLVRRGADAAPGETELAARTLGARIDASDAAIRRALEEGDGPELQRTTVYRRVFALAEQLERRALPRARVPDIDLRGPKIQRKLTTKWFAERVDGRYRRCLARASGA